MNNCADIRSFNEISLLMYRLENEFASNDQRDPLVFKGVLLAFTSYLVASFSKEALNEFNDDFLDMIKEMPSIKNDI